MIRFALLLLVALAAGSVYADADDEARVALALAEAEMRLRQVPEEPPMPPTYTDLRLRAIAEQRPLVVGVGCEPPSGDWLTHRSEELPPFSGPCVVVSYSSGGQLWWKATLPAHATAGAVARALRGDAGGIAGPPPVRTPAFYPPPQFSGGFANCGPRG